MKRLAEADPAPADEALSYGASSSVLFDTICDRSGEMKPVTTTPWWRRGPVVAVAVFVLVVAAGFVILMAGATPDSEVVTPNEPTTAPPTTVATTATPTTAEVQTAAVDDALGLWEARYGPNSDPSIWAGYLSPDSPAFAPSDWEWIDDFDRDGVVAFADWMQFQIAMNSAFGTTAEYECEEVSADTAQCGVTATDFFYQVGGAEPPGFEVLMTFESGILAVEEPVEAANAATQILLP